MNHAKTSRVLLGLHLLCHARKEARHCFTQAEIAAWCGCSQQAINKIERNALRRLRYYVPKELRQ